jgi:hypothetical protein
MKNYIIANDDCDTIIYLFEKENIIYIGVNQDDDRFNSEEVKDIDSILEFIEDESGCEFDKFSINLSIEECNDKDSKLCGYLFMCDLERKIIEKEKRKSYVLPELENMKKLIQDILDKF